MANEFYTRGAEFNPDEIADGDAIEAEFNAIVAGFDKLGSASKKTATTSSLDNTAGRLMSVGDFGVGSSSSILLTSEQANAQSTPAGLYLATASEIGSPGGITTIGFLIHQRATASATQTFVATGASNRSFRRTYNNGVAAWTAWYEIMTSNNVTASDSDTTAGKLLKVGDFGLGAAGTVKTRVTDLNAITAAGFYVTNTSATPAPVAGQPGYLWHQDWDGVATNKRQVFFLSSLERFFIRYCISGVWGSWSEVYHNFNIVGTTSQSGGIPTGAIVESGTNANGRYVRFANGTQITHKALTVTTTIDIAMLGGFRSVSTQTAYAASFAEAPSVTCTPTIDSGVSGVCINVATTTVNISLTAISSQASAARTVYVTAIGRWF